LLLSFLYNFPTLPLQVAQLLEYCLEKEKSEEGGVLHVPMEVVEAISHLGIYYHNFEHYRHGLILLQLAEQLMNHMDQRTSDKSKSESTDGAVNVLSNGGSSAVKVNSARTHVMFYLAQVRKGIECDFCSTP
jgi:hypothetical protein